MMTELLLEPDEKTRGMTKDGKEEEDLVRGKRTFT